MSQQSPKLALETLSIRDFRGIESLDLNFCGPDGLVNRLVVIGGPNGCGKTTVLEAAILLLDQGHQLPWVARRDDRRSGADRFTLEGQVYDSFTASPKRVRRLTSAGRDPNEEACFILLWYFPSWRTSGLGGPVNVDIGSRRSPRKVTQDGLRLSKKLPSKATRERLKAVKQRLVNAAAVERFSQNGPRIVTEYSRQIELINQAWNEFDPAGDATIQVELIDTYHQEGGSFDLFYQRPGQPRLGVDQLSSGQLELFLFIAEMVFHREQAGIVFIDEPELHLDPQWHRPFLRSLMRLRPLMQFIVTTHSPEIYDSAYSYERHFLISEDDPRARLWTQSRRDVVEA